MRRFLLFAALLALAAVSCAMPPRTVHLEQPQHPGEPEDIGLAFVADDHAKLQAAMGELEEQCAVYFSCKSNMLVTVVSWWTLAARHCVDIARECLAIVRSSGFRKCKFGASARPELYRAHMCLGAFAMEGLLPVVGLFSFMLAKSAIMAIFFRKCLCTGWQERVVAHA